MQQFEVQIEARWADTDQNRHVRHSAYYDYGAHARIKFFREAGFDMARLSELNIGPIIFKEECTFLRELHPDDTITINLLKGTMSDDGSRWSLHHEIFNTQGDKCAHISLKGAFMDLKHRRLTAPPEALAEHMQKLKEGEAFVYRKARNT